MVSSYIIYGLGLVVSLVNIILWLIILQSQVKQYNHNQDNNRIKTALLVFGLISLFSNITPIWFDIYRLVNMGHLTNIGYAYTVSQYVYRTVTAFMFYIIYRS